MWQKLALTYKCIHIHIHTYLCVKPHIYTYAHTYTCISTLYNLCSCVCVYAYTHASFLQILYGKRKNQHQLLPTTESILILLFDSDTKCYIFTCCFFSVHHRSNRTYWQRSRNYIILSHKEPRGNQVKPLFHEGIYQISSHYFNAFNDWQGVHYFESSHFMYC